jgi:hypothetical protein
MKRLFIPFLSLFLLGGLVFAQTTSMNLTWTWTPPTTGSAVHHYIVESSSNGSSWVPLAAQPTTATITLSAPVNVNIQIRVAGVDAQSRQGVWSTPSDPFTPDAGVPGACGKPTRST